MKKIFIIAMMALFSLTLTAQEETNEPPIQVNIEMPGDQAVTDTDFEKLFDKYTAKAGAGINNLLKSVQENFTDEAEFVWRTYLMKYKVKWFSQFAVFVFALLIFISGFPMYKQHLKQDPNSSYSHNLDDTAAGVGAMIFWGIGGFLSVLMFIFCVTDLSYLIVPEYHVIQDLLGILR